MFNEFKPMGPITVMTLIFIIYVIVTYIWAFTKKEKDFKQAVKNGDQYLPSIKEYLDETSDKITFFVKTNDFWLNSIMLAAILAILMLLWLISGWIIVIASLVILSIAVLLWINKAFCQTEHRVFRYLKKNPDLVEEIMTKPVHRWHDLAKKLHTAGVIKMDKATQMIEIDGKKYTLKIQDV